MTTLRRGFTLIEAIVYLALFSILMGGGIVAAYSLFDATTRAGTRTILHEETDFLLSKVDWALSGAEAVTAPGAGATGSALTVAKWDASSGDPIVIAKNGDNLTMSRGGGAAEILNNTNVSVTSISFEHVADPGNGTVPEYVTAVIQTSAPTPSGALLTRVGTTTVYLRR